MLKHIHIASNRSAKAFTLVEMLIVGALIALFSGLAVFSITTQFNINKQKASVGECRQLATALSFAHQDLGFFPKLCFLRFNLFNLKQEMFGYQLSTKAELNELENANLPVGVGSTGGRLDKIWRGPYCAFSQDRVVQMSVRSEDGSVKHTTPEDWPGDPFGNPYVAYFVVAESPSTVGGTPTYRFMNSAGEDPNYFAGVVSYGRNHVPGLGEDPTGPDLTGRQPLCLYKTDSSTPKHFLTLTHSEYAAPGMVDMIRIDLTPVTGSSGAPAPRIREVGSDDRYVEF